MGTATSDPNPFGKPINVDLDLAPPPRLQGRVAQFAIELLKKRKLVQLDYFTDRGMRLARGVDPNTPESALLNTPLAGIRSDAQLTMDEIHNAVPRFLRHIQEVGWGDKAIRAHADFFASLDTFLNSRDPEVQPGLARAEEEWRMEWHAGVAAGKIWDLGTVPEAEIQRTVDETRRMREQEEWCRGQERREAEHQIALVSAAPLYRCLYR